MNVKGLETRANRFFGTFKRMKNKKALFLWGGLLLTALAIRLYSANPLRVENGYSGRFYEQLGVFLRSLFGWIPFSIGDVLYGMLFTWMIWRLFKGMKLIWLRQATRKGTMRSFLKAFGLLLVVYISFNLLWGINYNRKGVAHQLDLKLEKYSLADLKAINQLLVEKVNWAKQNLIVHPDSNSNEEQLFSRVKNAYELADDLYPFLKYRRPSIKSSVWGWLGNYLGFTGYYNPFTGEAQVNTSIPYFMQPFVACHEVAHQLGYAREMEANFVGYLAASESRDTLIQYSVYLDLLLYSNRNLNNIDSLSARSYAKQLLPAVKADLHTWREFNRKHRNPVEPIFRWVYGLYLRNNEQPQGVLSYDVVTSFLIAFYKKTGKI